MSEVSLVFHDDERTPLADFADSRAWRIICNTLAVLTVVGVFALVVWAVWAGHFR